MIVPGAAVALFRKKGCRFTPKTVASAGDVPSGEMDRLRGEG
jgi:hypothetical protein